MSLCFFIKSHFSSAFASSLQKRETELFGGLLWQIVVGTRLSRWGSGGEFQQVKIVKPLLSRFAYAHQIMKPDHLQTFPAQTTAFVDDAPGFPT